MATKITATELAKNLSDVLSRAQYRGESFVIERNGEQVATLGPPELPRGPTLYELVQELRKLPRPDDRFADDLEEIHSAQRTLPASKWPDS
jgi:antitoxin (DNA-binding transcriptional repressor) of toxin-antitoxin stability system